MHLFKKGVFSRTYYSAFSIIAQIFKKVKGERKLSRGILIYSPNKKRENGHTMYALNKNEHTMYALKIEEAAYRRFFLQVFLPLFLKFFFRFYHFFQKGNDFFISFGGKLACRRAKGRYAHNRSLHHHIGNV